jgi:hypothetical protein
VLLRCAVVSQRRLPLVLGGDGLRAGREEAPDETTTTTHQKGGEWISATALPLHVCTCSSPPPAVRSSSFARAGESSARAPARELLVDRAAGSWQGSWSEPPRSTTLDDLLVAASLADSHTRARL